VKPTVFEGANKTLTSKNQDIADLAACVGDGYIVSQWKATFLERLSILIFGKVWVCLLTDRQPPISLIGGRSAYWELPE
jgi:hypothetical protein